jgi:hypothetical protein
MRAQIQTKVGSLANLGGFIKQGGEVWQIDMLRFAQSKKKKKNTFVVQGYHKRGSKMKALVVVDFNRVKWYVPVRL